MTDLDPGPVVRALLLAQRSGQSGALESHAGDLFTVVYFHAGRAVFAEGGTLKETLGRLLVSQGRLTQDQYARVIADMTAKLVDNEQMRFGEAAVKLGFLTGGQVSDALADQVKRKIVRVLEAHDVRTTFRVEPDAVVGLPQYPCTIEPIVLAVCRDGLAPERVDALVAPFALQRLQARQPTEVAARFAVSPRELHVLRSLDGTRTVVDICVEYGRAVALPVLAAVLLADELRPSQATPSPPREAPAVRVLVEAPPVRVPVEAPPRPAREAAPDPAELRRRAMAAAASLARPRRAATEAAPLKAAHETPSSSGDARADAENAFLRGKRDLREGKTARALPHLRRASELRPEDDGYELHVAFAELLVASDDRARADAKQILRALVHHSLKKDPDFAFALHVDGHLALLDENTVRAERSFRRAYKLDPTEIDAQRQLRLLKLRSPPSK